MCAGVRVVMVVRGVCVCVCGEGGCPHCIRVSGCTLFRHCTMLALKVDSGEPAQAADRTAGSDRKPKPPKR